MITLGPNSLYFSLCGCQIIAIDNWTAAASSSGSLGPLLLPVVAPDAFTGNEVNDADQAIRTSPVQTFQTGENSHVACRVDIAEAHCTVAGQREIEESVAFEPDSPSSEPNSG